jgi:hypothetical protein
VRTHIAGVETHTAAARSRTAGVHARIAGVRGHTARVDTRTAEVSSQWEPDTRAALPMPEAAGRQREHLRRVETSPCDLHRPLTVISVRVMTRPIDESLITYADQRVGSNPETSSA